MDNPILDFKRIPTILKRCSFESKMNTAQFYSRQLMIYSGAQGYRFQIPLPWEIEAFVLYSVYSKEWKYEKISSKNFWRIMNSIRNYIPPKLVKYKGTTQFLTWFKITAASTQFYSQQNYMFLFYRYNYYFSFHNDVIDMNDIFVKKFQHEHYDYLLMAQSLWLALMSEPETVFSAIMPLIHDCYRDHISKLAISRSEYIKQMDNYSGSFEDFLYSFRPSYSYPFIEYENNYYLPTPHLLFQSVCGSMMYRLTEDNEDLRRTIGKEVFESYLLKIIIDSNEFDQALPEHDYEFKGGQKKTVDVMAIKNATIVLLDRKSYVPKSKLRLISEEALNDDIGRIAKAIVQVYKHTRNRVGKEYYYFEKKKEYIDFENDIFGVVIIEEDGYLPEEEMYNSAALKLKLDASETEWLRKHIFVLSLYDLERILFANQSLISFLRKKAENPDFIIDYPCNIECEAINSFRKNFCDEMQKRTWNLVKDIDDKKVLAEFYSKMKSIESRRCI